MTEAEVYKHLRDDAALSAIISNRIYPIIAPQNAIFPLITYQVISGLKIQCLGGEIFKGDYRMQLNCYAETYSKAKAVSQAVKECLVGFMSSYDIDIMDEYEDEAQLFKQVIDFKITDKD